MSASKEIKYRKYFVKPHKTIQICGAFEKRPRANPGGPQADFLLSTSVMKKVQRSEWITRCPGVRRWLICFTRGRTQTGNITHRKHNARGRQTARYKPAAQMSGRTVARAGLHGQRQV